MTVNSYKFLENENAKVVHIKTAPLSRYPTTIRTVAIASHEAIFNLNSFVCRMICRMIVCAKDMKKVDNLKFTNKTVENMLHLVGGPFIISGQFPYLFYD